MNSVEVWETIQLLRATKGTNAKKTILQVSPGMQEVLKYTYDPFKQYGVSVPASIGVGVNGVSQKTFEILDALAAGTLSGNAAKNAIRSHLTELDYPSGEVFKCILDKSLNVGLAETSINEVFPGLIPNHPIMLAYPVDWKRIKFPCFISPKIDGLRAVYREGKFYSRKGHKLRGLTKLAEQCQHLFLDSVLDGELIVPGVTFDETSGALRSFEETPDAVYHVFDLPASSVEFTLRYAILKQRDTISHKTCSPQVSIVPHEMVFSSEQAEEAYAIYRREGYEGAILKDPYAKYVGKRSWAWQKMKAKETADCKVVGLFLGQGKYEGLLGGINVDFNGVVVSVGSGLTDLQRNVWADEPEEIMGKIVEVAYQEVTPNGSLRHPRLVGIRGDK